MPQAEPEFHGGTGRKEPKIGRTPSIRWKPLEPADDFPTNLPIAAASAHTTRQSGDARAWLAAS
jgi:hypothetical protein